MRSVKEVQNVVTKEISKGVFLHKQQHIRDEGAASELIYIFRVEVKTFQVLEFTADFTDSENLALEDHEDLVSVTTIWPFTTEVIAVLRLFKNWKLKSKFRFTMHSPPIKDQRKYLQNYFGEIEKEVKVAVEKLKMVPTDLIPVADLEALLRKNSLKFVDPDFLPSDKSLYGQQDSPFDTLIQWRRPEDFLAQEDSAESHPLALYNPAIEIADIHEGLLGDGWLISAIATLAEVPPLIDRLFLTKEISKEGVYRVKLCKNGEWVVVTIDDYFPCIPDGGAIFGKSSANELWLMVLEKAYAKLHGSYLTLKGGYAHEALMDLTGCPCTYYNFEDEFVKDMVKSGVLWEQLRDADEKGYLLSASTPGEQRWEDSPVGEGEENALLEGHSYTISGLVEVKGYKLVKVRNQWGQFEW
eukprot:TRINITY_DN1133_c0_g2_i3.p2 TRINITY_DN1133_c0_g2~~TRINITY_DN1133_c0_g2_i3.p2  ORF type:complete len:448 (-),score=145.12 TRINITY_DN1133_c0_g2_i3:1362-2600(-)